MRSLGGFASENRFDIFPDFARRTPVVDPDDHHLFISLGAAAENLSLASAANGTRAFCALIPVRALRTGDGLYTAASGNPALPGWLGPHAFDLLSSADAENDVYARQLGSSAGVGVFVGSAAGPAQWVAVGQACQRFALQAKALGLKHAFVNQPVEVGQLRPELAGLIGMTDRRPDIVMRFGYGPTLPWSPRRSLASVIVA